MPRMKHPDGPQRIDVAPTQVPLYESQGWRVVTTQKKPTTAKKAADK